MGAETERGGIMALSEQEQRLLDEMERSFYQSDADVVSTSNSADVRLSARAIVISILALAVGVAIIIAGIAIEWPWIGLIGFIVMVGGVYWALTNQRGSRGESAAKDAPGPKPASGSGGARKRPAAGGSFMQRMEDRWDRRQDGRS